MSEPEALSVEINGFSCRVWKKGEGPAYYVSAAGGFAYRADKGRVSVRYANGEVRTRRRSLFFSSDPTPGPGSEVFVPVKDTLARTDWVALAGAIAQILASVVTIAVVATKL